MPEGWCWCHLDELFLFIRNGKSIKQIKGAGGFPITRIETISNSVIDRERMGYANITDTKGLEEYILRNGDILMSHINSPIHVGKSALCCDISEDEIILHGMNLLCLRPHSGIDSFYLDMYFNSPIFRDLIRPYIKNAVNQASINTQNIGNTYIPVPPLAEQIRISNMYKLVNTYLTDLTLSLEGLTYSISSAKSKILDLAIHGKLVPQDVNDEPASELLKRINPKALTSCDNPHYENVPYEIPSTWAWVKLGDIAQSNIGLTYKPSDIIQDGVPVMRSNNIQNGVISNDDIVRVNTKLLNSQVLNNGDLLICARNGSKKLVGKCALVNNLQETTSFGAFMAVCRSDMNNWLYHVLSSEYFKNYLDDSNSTTIHQVTQKMLLTFEVPLPPLMEQERICTKIKELYNFIDDITDALS